MEWISVKDRLPEAKHGERFAESDMVLVYGAYTGDYCYGLGVCCYDRENVALTNEVVWAGDLDGMWDFVVTHWMPLPEPPKEGQR